MARLAAPMTPAVRIAVADAERLFRARVAAGVTTSGRVELAAAARDLARVVLPLDSARAVALIELAELVEPFAVRTYC